MKVKQVPFGDDRKKSNGKSKSQSKAKARVGMADFLFEIGLEEVPARMLASAEAELLRRTVALLERERLVPDGAEAKSYSTPRRLAVLVRNVFERQSDTSAEVLGPSAKIAFRDGVAGPAAIAF